MSKLYDPYADFKEFELSNGLKVYYLCQPGRPWLAVGVVIHVGALSDPAGLLGVAHFVEHLASDNVPGYKASDIENFFSELGGQVFLGSTSFLSTRYKFFIPAVVGALRKAGDIFGQMLFGHDLTVEIEVERGIILQEYRRRFSFDYQLEWVQKIFQELRPGFWDPERVCPLGNLKTVSAIDHSDLEAFYRQQYTPANASLVIVGGLDEKEVTQVLNQSALARPKDGSRRPLPALLEVVPPPSCPKLEFHIGEYNTIPVDYFDYSQGVCLPGRYRHLRLTEVVRGMLSSRLFDELREKRSWTYSTRVEANDCGSFVEFIAGVEKVSLSAQSEMAGIVAEIIADLPNRQGLFEQTKQSQLKCYDLHDVNDRCLCDNVLDDLADHQKIITLGELVSETKSLTRDDLADFCTHLQPEQALTVIKCQ